MKKPKTLVFCGAHPDDESFGVGATLAQYASSGVRVYYICATGGEMGTVDKEFLGEHGTVKELRAAEMRCAAKELGLAGVFYLGYRDSGMQGAAENKHPEALAMASPEETAGRIVGIIREIKPEVVITHDAGGGYGHPDHIATHNATIKAFYAAGVAEQYPEAGPAFQPSKLYFGVRSFKAMKFMIRLLPLFGQDPHHFGRNKDIDLTEMNRVEYPIHAVIRLRKQSSETRNRAAACHASQNGGRRRPGLFRIIGIFERLSGAKDYFMREYPPPTRGRENDLFEGI
jgi:LmbE family N-acetylglucosaminyl deacetylase